MRNEKEIDEIKFKLMECGLSPIDRRSHFDTNDIAWQVAFSLALACYLNKKQKS